MAAPTRITVGEYSRPTRTYVWTNRDQGDEEDPDTAVTITGYSFELHVRRVPKLETGLGTVVLIDLAGAIVVAADGTYSFTMTAAHTGLPPGEYSADLLVWTTGATTNPPHYKKALTFEVTSARKRPDDA